MDKGNENHGRVLLLMEGIATGRNRRESGKLVGVNSRRKKFSRKFHDLDAERVQKVEKGQSFLFFCI